MIRRALTKLWRGDPQKTEQEGSSIALVRLDPPPGRRRPLQARGRVVAPHPKSAEVAHVTRLAGGLDMPEKKSPEAQRLTEQWFVLLSSREATRGPNGADLYKPWKVVGAFTNADDALDFARTKVARIGVLVRVAQAHVDIRARVDFEVVRPGMTP